MRVMIHKKISVFLFLMLCSAFLVVNAPVSQAAVCPTEMGNIQENYGAAVRAERDATTKGGTPRPDPVEALTCFDQAMIASSKAGAIFSDKPATFLPDFGGIIASGLGAAMGGPFGDGTTSTLGQQIGSVVEPSLSNIMSSFTDALSAAMGSVLSSAFGDTISSIIGSFPGLDGILGGLLGQTMDCTVMPDLRDGYIIGQGINPDIGSISVSEIINNPGAVSSMGDVFQTVIGANSDVFNAVATDIENLNTPGYFPFTPTLPSLPPNASVQDVIDAF